MARCKDCVFFDCGNPVYDGDDGLCRHHAPSHLIGDLVFPKVNGVTDWCGDFQQPERVKSEKFDMASFDAWLRNHDETARADLQVDEDGNISGVIYGGVETQRRRVVILQKLYDTGADISEVSIEADPPGILGPDS